MTYDQLPVNAIFRIVRPSDLSTMLTSIAWTKREDHADRSHWIKGDHRIPKIIHLPGSCVVRFVRMQKDTHE